MAGAGYGHNQPSFHPCKHLSKPTIMVVRRRIHPPLQRITPPAARRRERVKLAQAMQRLMERWGVPTVVLSRLTPLTAPCDIAAAVVGMSLRVFTVAVVLGRVLYVLAWLGAGRSQVRRGNMARRCHNWWASSPSSCWRSSSCHRY